MKLLPVKELNTKLNDQKKSEIDAGLFLAKKIDRLREEVADTQKDHDDFIEKKNIEKEIFVQAQNREKESLIKEIEDLKEERRILQIPLDEEWRTVKIQSEKNTDFSLELIQKEFSFKKKESDFEIKDKNLSSREQDVIDSEIIVQKNLNDSIDVRERSKILLEKTERFKTESEIDIRSRIEIIEKKESDLKYKEFHVQKREQKVAEYEKEIINDKRVIADQRATLERAFKRLNG